MYGYTSLQAVEEALGRDLTDAEVARFDAVAEAAEAEIGRLTGMVWPSAQVTVASAAVPVTGELHRLDYGPTVRLGAAPLDSVDEVRMRLRGTTTSRTLVADVDYEADLDRGTLYLVTPYVAWGYRWLEADYTPSIGVPSNVAEATARLAASLVSGAASSAASTFSRVTIGEDTFQYRDDAAAAQAAALSTGVGSLLAAYLPPVLV